MTYKANSSLIISNSIAYFLIFQDFRLPIFDVYVCINFKTIFVVI